MTPEQVLAIAPRVLTQAQREFYFDNGYLLLEGIIEAERIARLRAATDEAIEKSREVTASDATWDLEKGHTRDAPRLRRLSSPNDFHPAYWEFASQSIVPSDSGRIPTTVPARSVPTFTIAAPSRDRSGLLREATKASSTISTTRRRVTGSDV